MIAKGVDMENRAEQLSHEMLLEVVFEMCKYLQWASKHPEEPDSAIFAATLIAQELFPNACEEKK